MLTQRRTILAAVVLLSMLAVGFITASIMQPQVAQADGRINCHNASPVVIYCSALGITVYTTDGQIILEVDQADITAVGTPEENTLVATSADGTASMYVLSSGEYQINVMNGDEIWVAIWVGCNPGIADLKAYDAETWELLSDEEGCEVDACEGLSEWECACGPNPGDSQEFGAWVECYCEYEPDDEEFCGRFFDTLE